MKNKIKLLAIVGLSAILLIPCLAFVQSQEQKKTRHIKMMKIENGKKMEIDTILTGNDVFVWNGDTIGPEKHIKGFSPSEFDKRHPEHMDKTQKRRSPIRRGGAMEDRLIIRGDSAEEFQIITDDGDTTGQKIIIHKMRRDGDEKDHLIYRHHLQGDDFPPVPPVPPVPHIKMFRGNQSNKGINLNDPNVISFKKKDIGGGREKIEIIRKKTKESENMNMEIDQLIDIPQPPMVPSMDEEQNDQQNMLQERIEIEKSKVDKKAERKAAKENK